jgi:hypothetical protein
MSGIASRLTVSKWWPLRYQETFPTVLASDSWNGKDDATVQSSLNRATRNTGGFNTSCSDVRIEGRVHMSTMTSTGAPSSIVESPIHGAFTAIFPFLLCRYALRILLGCPEGQQQPQLAGWQLSRRSGMPRANTRSGGRLTAGKREGKAMT